MDPEELRRAGHRLVDWIAEYLQGVEGRPLFPDAEPREVNALFDGPLPQEPREIGAILDELEQKLVPHCTHVGHPGYMGLITPSPLPVGILGDFLASALNQNVGAYSIGPGAVAMERRVVRWLCDLAGYGGGAGGHLTSGGTMANFEGLKLARDAVSGNRAQHEGVHERSAVYANEERHVSVDKAVDAVGIGRDLLRALPTDDAFRVRLDALEAAIAADRAAGIRPLCVVGLAGTTNTGAVDDLEALRAVCDREGMWLHVDAAYGGGMLLSERRHGVLRGLALADSITIDPHKWFYAPLDAGALLARDATQLTRSFGMKPAYLTDELDAENERFQYFVHSFEQSRRFRGLKVWMAFQRHGARAIGSWVDANCDVADRMDALFRARPDFVVATRPTMSAVCARYAPRGESEEALSELHKRVVARIERGGRFWFSTTVMKGRTWFRINPVNFRTRLEHADELVELLAEECRAETSRRPGP